MGKFCLKIDAFDFFLKEIGLEVRKWPSMLLDEDIFLLHFFSHEDNQECVELQLWSNDQRSRVV